MAYNSMWYESHMSSDMCQYLIHDFAKAEIDAGQASTLTSEIGEVKAPHIPKLRDATVSWIQEDHWIQGFLWHHVQKANYINWKYDIVGFERGSIQLSSYGPHQHYSWHNDVSIDNMYGGETPRPEHPREELIRKLSISLFLTTAGEDHEGGEFQLMTSPRSMKSWPAVRGSMVIFDSSMTHRVRPVKSGTRISIVGWAVGPRWR